MPQIAPLAAAVAEFAMTMPRVVVMGGSLGGLNAAVLLRDLGCVVDVYERSPRPLEGRGAGIVLHPATVRYLVEHDVMPLQEVSTATRRWRFLARDGNVVHEERCLYRFTSFNTLNHAFLRCFDRDRYHLGRAVIDFEQKQGSVQVTLEDGEQVEAELLVAADGIHSTARRILFPTVEPVYAGYVGWRGTVEDSDLSQQTFHMLADSLTYHVLEDGHILAYPIPALDGAVKVDNRLINWIWYRNVAEGDALADLLTDVNGMRQKVSLGPGRVRAEHVKELQTSASGALPPILAEAVTSTDEPFLQAIFDVEVARMVSGRACVIGDAAFALRPHAAAGTAKAAADGWALAEALENAGGDAPRALAAWEPRQLELGRAVLARTKELGARSQFLGTFTPGDPYLRFGLHSPGDSFF